MFAVVDSMSKALKVHLRRLGLKPECSESESIARGLTGEWLGQDEELPGGSTTL